MQHQISASLDFTVEVDGSVLISWFNPITEKMVRIALSADEFKKIIEAYEGTAK